MYLLQGHSRRESASPANPAGVQLTPRTPSSPRSKRCVSRRCERMQRLRIVWAWKALGNASTLREQLCHHCWCFFARSRHRVLLQVPRRMYNNYAVMNKHLPQMTRHCQGRAQHVAAAYCLWLQGENPSRDSPSQRDAPLHFDDCELLCRSSAVDSSRTYPIRCI